jgi:hypothetical protein
MQSLYRDDKIVLMSRDVSAQIVKWYVNMTLEIEFMLTEAQKKIRPLIVHVNNAS